MCPSSSSSTKPAQGSTDPDRELVLFVYECLNGVRNLLREHNWRFIHERMNRLLKLTSFPLLVLPMLIVGACSTAGDVGISSSAQPRLATWRCTNGVKLTIRRDGSNLRVADSRGFDVELPPDPPGQRERFGKTGYALVFAGRTASWFASGQVPTDCRR